MLARALGGGAADPLLLLLLTPLLPPIQADKCEATMNPPTSEKKVAGIERRMLMDVVVVVGMERW